MRRLVYGRYTEHGNEALSLWIAKRIPYVGTAQRPFPNGECVGVYEGRRLIAAVAFYDWDPNAKILQCAMAADTPMWAKPQTILDILRVPFELMIARKLYVMIRADNQRVIKFVKNIGFKEEGRLSEHYAPGLHAVVLGLKRNRYTSVTLKRLNGDQQVGRAAAA